MLTLVRLIEIDHFLNMFLALVLKNRQRYDCYVLDTSPNSEPYEQTFIVERCANSFLAQTRLHQSVTKSEHSNLHFSTPRTTSEARLANANARKQNLVETK